MNQFDTFEQAVVDYSKKHACSQFEEDGTLAIGSDKYVAYEVYKAFSYYEGPLRIRYLQILQLYSIFERYAIYFAKEISKKDSLIDIDKLKAPRTYTAVHIYYSEVCDISFSNWSELDKLRTIRNLIAHTDGFIEFSEQKSKIEKIVSHDSELILLKNDRVGVSKQFIKNSMKAVFSFFDIVEPKTGKTDGLFTFDGKLLQQFHAFNAKAR
jgi:hypothetical protein